MKLYSMYCDILYSYFKFHRIFLFVSGEGRQPNILKGLFSSYNDRSSKVFSFSLKENMFLTLKTRKCEENKVQDEK